MTSDIFRGACLSRIDRLTHSVSLSVTLLRYSSKVLSSTSLQNSLKSFDFSQNSHKILKKNSEYSSKNSLKILSKFSPNSHQILSKFSRGFSNLFKNFANSTKFSHHFQQILINFSPNTFSFGQDKKIGLPKKKLKVHFWVRNLPLKIGIFQFLSKCWKVVILFCKFLLENCAVRKNGVHHDKANGKSYETVISDFWIFHHTVPYYKKKWFSDSMIRIFGFGGLWINHHR